MLLALDTSKQDPQVEALFTEWGGYLRLVDLRDRFCMVFAVLELATDLVILRTWRVVAGATVR